MLSRLLDRFYRPGGRALTSGRRLALLKRRCRWSGSSLRFVFADSQNERLPLQITPGGLPSLGRGVCQPRKVAKRPSYRETDAIRSELGTPGVEPVNSASITAGQLSGKTIRDTVVLISPSEWFACSRTVLDSYSNIT